MESSSKNLKTNKQTKNKWIDYLILEKWRDFRFFTFIEEFGDELIIHTKQEI